MSPKNLEKETPLDLADVITDFNVLIEQAREEGNETRAAVLIEIGKKERNLNAAFIGIHLATTVTIIAAILALEGAGRDPFNAFALEAIPAVTGIALLGHKLRLNRKLSTHG